MGNVPSLCQTGQVGTWAYRIKASYPKKMFLLEIDILRLYILFFLCFVKSIQVSRALALSSPCSPEHLDFSLSRVALSDSIFVARPNDLFKSTQVSRALAWSSPCAPQGPIITLPMLAMTSNGSNFVPFFVHPDCIP